MLSPVTQIGPSSLEIAPSLFFQRSTPDWLHVELDGLEVVATEKPAEIPLLFVRRLVVDDSLRAELKTDPVAVLARHGIHATPEQIPAVVNLPSPEALEGALRIHASEEDRSAIERWLGFLGGLLDDLLGTGDD